MKFWKVASCLGAGALCVVTGGLAAPAVAAAVTTMAVTKTLSEGKKAKK